MFENSTNGNIDNISMIDEKNINRYESTNLHFSITGTKRRMGIFDCAANKDMVVMDSNGHEIENVIDHDYNQYNTSESLLQRQEKHEKFI